MNKKGFTLIELLVVILIIGILLALIIPNFVLFQERARRSSVKNNMHVVQTTLEAYAVDHNGNYPNEDLSWDYGDETGIAPWFPGGDPIGEDGTAIPGNFPINPYTGSRYNSDNEDGSLSYTVNDLLSDPGLNAQTRSDDDDCPWVDYACDAEVQGSIGIQGYAPDEQVSGAVEEYGIAGWGRDMTQAMFDRDVADEEVFIFFVLHN